MLKSAILPRLPTAFPFLCNLDLAGQEILPFPSRPSGSIADRPGGTTYNCFHTTAMCSPGRRSWLTGRNHESIGAGQNAELANDGDGYSGMRPKTSATLPEVLKAYGYHTGAWGGWHNTPAGHTTSAVPSDYWPTGYGFEHLYGFLAGEASQYEPCPMRNTASAEPPHTSGGHHYYHLSEDLAHDAINWLRQHKASAPDKPFFIGWFSGTVEGAQVEYLGTPAQRQDERRRTHAPIRAEDRVGVAREPRGSPAKESGRNIHG